MALPPPTKNDRHCHLEGRDQRLRSKTVKGNRKTYRYSSAQSMK